MRAPPPGRDVLPAVRSVTSPEVPLAVLYEPEPYYGWPNCESAEYGLATRGIEQPPGGAPVYECDDCHTRYLGVRGVHYDLTATP